MTGQSSDDLFAELTATWQADNAPPTDDVEARVQRSLARMRRFTWLEIAISTIGSLFGLWVLLQGNVIIGAAAMVFAGVSLVLVLDYRRRDALALTEPVAVQLQSLYQLERGRYRRGWVGIVVCALAEGFLMVVALMDPALLQRLDGQLTLLGATIFIIVGLALSVRQILGGRVACERIEQLSKQV